MTRGQAKLELPALPAASRFSRAAQLLAVFTAVAVFPLVFVGAGVTSKDAGLAYPDGFFSNGHFWNPPGWWGDDATRWEHGHRLLGRLVGCLAIASAVAAWPARGTARWLSLATLGAIVVQGVLGMFRVWEISTLLAMMHGVFGQICFALAVVTAARSGRTWSEQRVRIETPNPGLLRGLSVAAALLLVVQLALGGALRHFQSSGALVGHLLGAVVTAFVVGWLAMWVMGQHPNRPLLAQPARILAVLIVLQLCLGGTAFVVTMMPARQAPTWAWLLPTAHTAVGALILAVALVLCVAIQQFLLPAQGSRFAGSSTAGEAAASFS